MALRCRPGAVQHSGEGDRTRVPFRRLGGGAKRIKMTLLIQWISVNRDSDKGDYRLIGIEIGKPFTT